MQRAHIHRDASRIEPCASPCIGLTTHFTQSPRAKGHDQARVFRDRNELPWAHKTFYGMLPATERLTAHHSAIVHAKLRLVVQHELALTQRHTKLTLNLCALLHGLEHRLVEDDRLAATQLLGPRERDVCTAKERLRLTRIHRVAHDRDRSAQENLLPMHMEGLAQRLLKLIDHHVNRRGTSVIGHHDQELIACASTHEIVLTHRLTKTLSNLPQHAITHLLTERLVHATKAIERHHHKGHAGPQHLGALKATHRLFHHRRAIGKARHKVERDTPLAGRLLLLQLAITCGTRRPSLALRRTFLGFRFRLLREDLLHQEAHIFDAIEYALHVAAHLQISKHQQAHLRTGRRTDWNAHHPGHALRRREHNHLGRHAFLLRRAPNTPLIHTQSRSRQMQLGDLTVMLKSHHPIHQRGTLSLETKERRHRYVEHRCGHTEESREGRSFFETHDSGILEVLGTNDHTLSERATVWLQRFV